MLATENKPQTAMDVACHCHAEALEQGSNCPNAVRFEPAMLTHTMYDSSSTSCTIPLVCVPSNLRNSGVRASGGHMAHEAPSTTSSERLFDTASICRPMTTTPKPRPAQPGTNADVAIAFNNCKPMCSRRLVASRNPAASKLRPQARHNESRGTNANTT